MKSRWRFAAIALLVFGTLLVVTAVGSIGVQMPLTQTSEGLLLPEESKHLSSIRQLTFEGTNAEAYWSPDGEWLVFHQLVHHTRQTKFSSCVPTVHKFALSAQAKVAQLAAISLQTEMS